MKAPYPIMLMTEERIRSVASIFTEGDGGLCVVDLFGDMRCVGTLWNIPLTFVQVQAILSR